MHPRLRSAVLALDDRLQHLVTVKLPVFTRDANVLAGEGVYTAEDWSRTRRLGAPAHGVDGHQYDSDERYLRYIHTAEARKVASARSLAGAWDFKRHTRVVEIGCGDMIQAYVITERWPAVDYLATDFDPYVIERCAGLPLLARIGKRVFDVLEQGLEAFAGRDLLISWGLDAALDDRQLTGLMASAARAKLPYLLCSPTTLGPITWVHQMATAGGRRRQLAAREIRMHGWARSMGCFARLARQADVAQCDVGRHGIYRCMLVERGARSPETVVNA